MTDKQRKEIVSLSIQTYGARQQMNHSLEEMGELIVEVSKNIRGFNNTHKIIEEMADVLVCFENLKMIFNISDDQLHIVMDHKLKRTIDRIKGNGGKEKKLL